MHVPEKRLPPGGVVSELEQLRAGAPGYSVSAEGSGPYPVPRPHGAGGGEVSEPGRDEEDAQLVGPHVVRHRCRHRRRNIRAHRPRGEGEGRPRRGAVLRRLRRLRLALRLLLH